MSATQLRHDEHRTNSPSAHVVVHDKSGLYVAVIAIVLSCLNLGALAMLPMLVDAKIQAGMAEAKQIANTGREHGRIALSEVERANAELAAKGLIRKAEH